MKYANKFQKKSIRDISGQINNLETSQMCKDNKVIEISYELFLTMMDGKVAQVLIDTSSEAVWTAYGARPSEINKLEKISTNPDNMSPCEYGLSTLYAWIRLYDMIW